MTKICHFDLWFLGSFIFNFWPKKWNMKGPKNKKLKWKVFVTFYPWMQQNKFLKKYWKLREEMYFEFKIMVLVDLLLEGAHTQCACCWKEKSFSFFSTWNMKNTKKILGALSLRRKNINKLPSPIINDTKIKNNILIFLLTKLSQMNF